MAKEALKRILDTETEAKNLTKAARDEAKQIIAKATEDVALNRTSEMDRCKRESAQLTEEMKRAVQAELDQILAEADDACKKLAEPAADKVSSAKKFLKERIVS
ncbi:MAG: hypothetical protein Q4P30_04015 [Eubacteriales bacterium]|nr:hypothetical protein [Eubacteriales bacterium]